MRRGSGSGCVKHESRDLLHTGEDLGVLACVMHSLMSAALQGYLAHKKTPSLRTLQ